MSVLRSKSGAAPRGGPHMLTEIYEQPEAVRATATDASIRAVLARLQPELARVTRIVIAATGSSRHAGIAAKSMIEGLSGIPVMVEYASELQYGASLPQPDSLVIAITQSGETGDTVAALRTARSSGAPVLAISNVKDASVMREADFCLHTKAGTERAVPSTKAFTAQLAALYLLAITAGGARGRLSGREQERHIRELLEMPEQLTATLENDSACEHLAAKLADCEKFVFAGRGIQQSAALDGALKLKETTYRSAQAYAGGELWHGPLATLDRETAVFFLLGKDRRDPASEQRYEQTLSNVRSLKGRVRTVVAICTQNDEAAAKAADVVFSIPCVPELLLPMIAIVPLQLFAYHLAIALGHDVDHPRNLTKFVVQERL